MLFPERTMQVDPTPFHHGSQRACVTAFCRYRERSLRVKNRMRVIRSSGSVRGEDGNILAYSAGRQPDVPAGAQPLETRIAIDLDDSMHLRCSEYARRAWRVSLPSVRSKETG
jgi:hypothetical protein